MTTLEAVNEILARSGLGTVAALDTNGPSMAANAERWLDREAVSIQSQEWHYNKRRKVTLSPVLYTFDNAGWTAATLTLTQTGAFADAQAGQTLTFDMTGGNTIGGDIVVASVVSDDSITLESTIDANDIFNGVAGVAKNNAIAVPSGVISADTDDININDDFCKRGGRLYDLDNNTDMFTESKSFEIVERLSFGCIPYPIQRLIMLRAALGFNTQFKKGDMYRVLQSEIEEATASANIFNSRKVNVNILGTDESDTFHGNRPRDRRWSSR